MVRQSLVVSILAVTMALACNKDAPPDDDPADTPDVSSGDTDVTSCVPDCTDATCGDDGCGGSCGTCSGAEVCTADRVCECGLLEAPCPTDFECIEGEQDGWDFCYEGPNDAIWVPAGPVVLGCDPVRDGDGGCPTSQRPQVEVQVPAFAMQITEMAAIDTTLGCRSDYRPAGCLDQADAQTACAAIGTGWRLCTEAEWEKAARGGCETLGEADGGSACASAVRRYPWGDDAPTCDLALFDAGEGAGCGTDDFVDIDAKQAGSSVYGAYNMAGNAAEWVADCWHDDWTGAPTADGGVAWTAGCDDAGAGVIKGGGYASDATGVLTSSRAALSATDDGRTDVGFRCCLTVD